MEFEYTRGGTLAYFGAYNVHRAQLMGRVAPTTGIAPFGELVAQVMTTEPYASARRVFWVVDNGSSHAGAVSIARMREAWPTAQLVHLPVHASWLNQSRSCSPSSNARWSNRPTSPTCTPSPSGWVPSSPATKPPPPP